MPPQITSPSGGITVTYIRGVPGVSAGNFSPALFVTTDEVANHINVVSSSGTFYSGESETDTFQVVFNDTEPDLGFNTLDLTAYDDDGNPGDTVSINMSVEDPPSGSPAACFMSLQGSV